MGIIKLHEKERKLKHFWNASRYYDYPDGQDLIGKLLFTNKMAGMGASLFGLVYASSYRPIPTTLRDKALRYFHFLIPSLGVATIFTCVTYVSTNIRKKDDYINYVLGGLAAGPILIPFTGNVGVGVIAGLVFSVLGAAQKTCKMNNKELFPDLAFKGWSTYYERILDTSLEPKRKGNWTK